jgi:hypothetical protein
MSSKIAPQAVAVLRLDLNDSSGTPTDPIHAFPARLMALSLGPQPLWLGFVVTDEPMSPIGPGMNARVQIAFLDEESARKTFRVGSSILFGDGVITRGVLLIEEYL